VQLWVTLDSSVDPVELIRRDDAQLRRIAVLDAVVNNGDRKGGHLLPTVAGHIYGIDHGVTFALEPKLRTLLWQWEGRPLTDEARDVLESLARGLSDGGDLRRNLGAHLDVSEIDATRDRVDGLLRAGVHPSPPPDWPPIPWPPF